MAVGGVEASLVSGCRLNRLCDVNAGWAIHGPQRKLAIMTNARPAVLVVEDEILVRMGIVSSLEDAGFEVFEASNYDEAMAMLVTNLSIRAMFTDIDMLPGINGLELAIAVRRRWPPVKIIVTSGHRHIRDEDLPVIGRFFGKPYDGELVAASLREMMLAA